MSGLWAVDLLGVIGITGLKSNGQVMPQTSGPFGLAFNLTGLSTGN